LKGREKVYFLYRKGHKEPQRTLRIAKIAKGNVLLPASAGGCVNFIHGFSLIYNYREKKYRKERQEPHSIAKGFANFASPFALFAILKNGEAI
jgi:hypothetical protein